jgi:small subunit ribosomal protein S29
LFYRKETLDAVLPEGLPVGMSKEFQDSMRTALLVRQSFLDLRDNFRRVVDPPMWSSHGKGALFALILSNYTIIFCVDDSKL